MWEYVSQQVEEGSVVFPQPEPIKPIKPKKPKKPKNTIIPKSPKSSQHQPKNRGTSDPAAPRLLAWGPEPAGPGALRAPSLRGGRSKDTSSQVHVTWGDCVGAPSCA